MSETTQGVAELQYRSGGPEPPESIADLFTNHTMDIKTSKEIGKIAGALANSQTEFKSVKKDTDNPYYSSKYADLAAIIAGTQPAMAKNGLVLIQSPIVDLQAQKAGVISLLAHSSGEWMQNELILPAIMAGKDGKVRFDAQSVGSAISYARRYTYQSLVGVAAELDDDANAASGLEHGSTQAQKAVAQRKVDEHKKSGSEKITMTAWREGRLALSGPGLPIIKSALSDKEKESLGIELNTKEMVVHIPSGQGFAFQAAAKSHGVTCVFASTTGGDPVLEKVDEVEPKPGKKWFFTVFWNGKKHSSFDKKIFPYLKQCEGKTAMLLVEENAKGYSNIKSILRLDGDNFSDEQNQTAISGDDLPPEMY